MLPHEFIIPLIACNGGVTMGLAIQCLRRGTIKKLRVIQLDGTLEGFQYALYNTVAACDPSLDGAAQAGVNEKLYRITPLLTVSSSSDSFVSDEQYPEDGVTNLDMPYACQDDHDGNPLAKTSSNQGDKIYLKIIAGGSGTKHFGVAMTVMDPMIS